jgi:sarcosine oxidase subunit beta
MEKNYDVVIVGGGILGCAVAYHLCSQSNLKVALIERGLVGMQTTSLAASIIVRGRSSRPQTDLVLETHRSLEALETKLGRSLDFRRVGSMHVAHSEASAQTFNRLADRLREIGDEPRELTVDQAKQMVPWLALDGAALIVHNPLDGFIDPYRFANAYLQAAIAHGGLDVHQSTEVLELQTRGRQIVGVDTDKGQFSADQVVVAAGPWANHLLRPLGSAAAMAPVRSHYWITGPSDLYSAKTPILTLPDANAYMRPEGGGLLFGLRSRINKWAHPRDLPKTLQGFSFDDDSQGWQSLEETAGPLLKLCPSLAEVEIKYYNSGPSGYTPDGKHVVGAAPNLDGVYLAAGCCGSGITISGGVGRVISQLVLGQTPTIDITSFSPDRFEPFDPYDQAFIERCAQSRFLKGSD